MKPQRCNRTITAGHGYRLLCPHIRGRCPLHDRKPHKAGASSSPGGVPPRLSRFDPWEDAA